MVLPTIKVLLGTVILTRWSVSISISKVIYEKGREHYQQGLAEYRKTGNERNISLAFLLLQEACVRTDYTIPTFVHDYAFALRTGTTKEKVDAELVVVSVLERGIVAQLDLLERLTSTNTTSYNSGIFDHKREISLYAVHLIDFYDVIHKHTGLGWEELGFVVSYFTLTTDDLTSSNNLSYSSSCNTLHLVHCHGND